MHKNKAVIMAYWPTSGSLLMNVNYSCYSVGIIKHFIQHNILFSDGAEKYLFCYIHWKQAHPCFGQSFSLGSEWMLLPAIQ